MAAQAASFGPAHRKKGDSEGEARRRSESVVARGDNAAPDPKVAPDFSPLVHPSWFRKVQWVSHGHSAGGRDTEDSEATAGDESFPVFWCH